MATLAKDNPLKPVHDRVSSIRKALLEFLYNVVGKMKALVKALVSFVDKVRSAIKEIAAKVGKKVVNSLLSMADRLISLFSSVEKVVTDAVKLSAKILDMIVKAADPSKVLKTLKALVQRYVKAVRTIFDYVTQLVSAIDPIEIALKVINTLSMALRLVFSWIVEVSGALSAVRKAKSLVKKGVKSLKIQVKEATDLMKEVNGLKIAA